MNIKTFNTIINKSDFMDTETSEVGDEIHEQYVALDNINITMRLIEQDTYCDAYIHKYFDKEPKIIQHNYYYNNNLIIKKSCIFGYVFGKPIYIPYPDYLDLNKNKVSNLNDVKYIKLNLTDTLRLNRIFGMSKDDTDLAIKFMSNREEIILK